MGNISLTLHLLLFQYQLRKGMLGGSSGPGSILGWGHCVVFLGKTPNRLAVPLSTEVYKWVPAG